MEFLNSRTSNCSNNETEIHNIYTPIALSGMCLISLVVSIPGVVLGLHEYCIKNNISNLRTERLLLYLSCVASVMSLVGSFQWIAIFTAQSDKLKNICSAVGYIWLVTGIFQTTITFCLGVHFFIQICQPKQLNVLRDEKIQKYKKLEFVYLSTAIVLSLILSPWPFLDGSFGYNQWICWINIQKNHSSDHNGVGFIEVTALLIFITITFLFTICVVVVIQVMVCLKKRSTKNLYIPVFMTYLIVSLVIVIVTLVVNFPLNQYVISIHTIQSISSISIGVSPLTASLVTSVAVIYKRLNISSSNSHQRLQYHSINNARLVSSATATDSTTRSTFWDSPGTGDIDQSISDYRLLSSNNRVYNYRTV